MHVVPLRGGSVRVAGALDFDDTSQGLIPRRLPPWTRPQVTDPILAKKITKPSAVRHESSTDATANELDVQQTMIRYTYQDDFRLPAYDLVIDGALHERRSIGEGNQLVIDRPTGKMEMIHGQPATVRFDLPSGLKRLELWLPQGAVVRLRELRVSDGATVEASPLDRRRWVHYGSSISHCVEADGPTETWPAVAARLAGVDLQSFGFGGQCHLDPFVARTIRDLPADVISVKAGINIINHDSMRERVFLPTLHGFIDTVREGHPDTPLLFVSPIICPSAEEHPGPTVPDDSGRFRVLPRDEALAVGALTLSRVRELMADVIAARRDAGDANLHYLSGLDLFGPDDAGDLPDALHPNNAGYARMGERFHRLAFSGDGAFA
jgi:hypothetical protein